jgi:hypothetical protein
VKVLKYSSRGGQRPEVKTLRVLGNQRLSSGPSPKRFRSKNAAWVNPARQGLLLRLARSLTSTKATRS